MVDKPINFYSRDVGGDKPINFFDRTITTALAETTDTDVELLMDFEDDLTDLSTKNHTMVFDTPIGGATFSLTKQVYGLYALKYLFASGKTFTIYDTSSAHLTTDYDISTTTIQCFYNISALHTGTGLFPYRKFVDNSNYVYMVLNEKIGGDPDNNYMSVIRRFVGGPQTSFDSSPFGISNGVWHHIAWVWTSSTYVKFYFDYQLITEGATSGVVPGAGRFSVEYIPSSTLPTIYMDALAVTHRVLTPSEFMVREIPINFISRDV